MLTVLQASASCKKKRQPAAPPGQLPALRAPVAEGYRPPTAPALDPDFDDDDAGQDVDPYRGGFDPYGARFAAGRGAS